MSAHAAHREAGGGCEPGGGGLTVERHVLDRLASDAPDQHADDDARPRGSAFFLNMGDAHPGADAFFSVLQELGAQHGVAGQPECLRRGHRCSAAACRRRGAPSSSRTASLHQFTSVVAAGASQAALSLAPGTTGPDVPRRGATAGSAAARSLEHPWRWAARCVCRSPGLLELRQAAERSRAIADYTRNMQKPRRRQRNPFVQRCALSTAGASVARPAAAVWGLGCRARAAARA